MSAEIKTEIISWVKTIIFAIVLAFCINNFVIVNASVPSGSMKETIQEGDRIVAFRLAYTFSDPERFDVIVFKYPDDESVLYIKRLIGLPGETVEIKDGEVYINGSETPLDDSFVENSATGDFGPYEVPEDGYFMMGDNRDNSEDSRYWDNTYVHKEKMLGKAMIKYFPSVGLIR